jgi:hypothetical protein
MTDKEFQAKADEYYQLCFDKDERQKIAKAEKGDEDALLSLQDEIYSFVLWATFYVLETKEYHLELAGGGPAAQLVVTTDLQGNVLEADFQFQDWFKPWTSARNQDAELLIRYARLVGIYEE